MRSRVLHVPIWKKYLPCKWLRTKVYFFFQAEDGIRDADVTGVQTCALPISGGQAHDERRHRAGLGIDGDDPGGVVAPAWRPPHALVGIAGEQPSALQVQLEGEADRGTVGLEAAATRCRLAQGPGDLVPGHVVEQQIGRERVGRRELAAEGGLLVVVAT